jgi:hypothetical protein
MTTEADRIDSRRPLRSALLGRIYTLLAARVDRLEWGDAQRLGRALGALDLAARRGATGGARSSTSRSPSPSFRPASAALGRASFLHLGTTLGECLWLAARTAPRSSAP